MLYQEKTELGTVGFSKEAFLQIIRSEAELYNGQLWLSGPKGRLPGEKRRLGLPANRADFAEIRFTGPRMELKLHVLIRFGCSIGSVSRQFGASLRKRIKDVCGFEPAVVQIHLCGMVYNHIVANRDLMIDV